jgi:hypothetical protein
MLGAGVVLYQQQQWAKIMVLRFPSSVLQPVAVA